MKTSDAVSQIMEYLRMEGGSLTVMRRGTILMFLKDEVGPMIHHVEEVKLALSRIDSGDWTREQACVAFGLDLSRSTARMRPTGSA